MGVLGELYQSVIIEHSRHPRNFGRLSGHDVAQEGINPSCGDELTLYLKVADGVIVAASFEGEGCPISLAAASLMTAAVSGASVAAAGDLARSFKAMIRGGEADPALGDSRALQGVAKLPARVKCATLAWLTLEAALERLPAKGAGSA